jgi:hypothetical protein
MEKYLPIIYVRGYAGSQGAVESTVDRPYYGFNLGSTQVRTGPDGDPDFFIFESPLVRLIRDHGYTDLFARIDGDGAVELLNGEDALYDTGKFPTRSLWIYRYYDRTSERAGDGTRDLIETTVLIRGKQIVMADQREEHCSALTVPAQCPGPLFQLPDPDVERKAP